MNKRIVGIYTVRDLLGVVCSIPECTGDEGDWLLESRLAANRAVQDYALGRCDEETFLDRVEACESVDMDSYLAVVAEGMREAEEKLTSLTSSIIT